MGMLCKIAGHRWHNGRCRRCGAEHAAHKWRQSADSCVSRCVVCGAEQAAAHQWASLDGPCREKCARCGAERENHRWVIDGCIRVCSKCGKSQGSHQWEKIARHHAKPHPDTYADGCKCIVCGATNFHGEHLFKRVQENGVAIIKCSVCGFVKDERPVTDAASARDEYAANADEGIFSGGVRGGW